MVARDKLLLRLPIAYSLTPFFPYSRSYLSCAMFAPEC